MVCVVKFEQVNVCWESTVSIVNFEQEIVHCKGFSKFFPFYFMMLQKIF